MARGGGEFRLDGRLSVDQPVQDSLHMGFCDDPLGPRHFHEDQHSLFVVMQDLSEDIDHFPITVGTAQHEVLQLQRQSD